MKQRRAYLVGPERVELREEPVPDPGPGEALVRIGAATTCGTDVKVFRRGGHPRMLEVPSPFGHELAGTVARTGEAVRGLSEGDRVVVANSAACGACEYCRASRENLCEDLEYLNGAFSEYLLVPARFVAKSTYRLPRDLPFEIASLAEPLACVVHGIEVSEIPPGADALVLGAGPIGLFFTGILAAGGHRVTVADPHPSRLEVAGAMGAAGAVRVGRVGGEEERLRGAASRPRGFDLAVDATGRPEAWSDAIRCVRPGGVVNLFGGCAPGTSVALDTHLVHYNEIAVRGAYHHRPATFARALELLSRRALRAELVLTAERRLDDVEDALRSMIEKKALKVVIRA